MTFGGGGISCVVRNVSDAGAALDVASPLGIPDEFDLLVEADGSRRHCRVVWRTERRIGVSFSPSHSAINTVPVTERIRQKRIYLGTSLLASRCRTGNAKARRTR